MKKLLMLAMASATFAATAENTVMSAPPASGQAPATTITSSNLQITNTPPEPVNAASNGGLYFGVGAGMGWNDQSAPAATFRLDGGYSFDQYWALEVGTTGLTQSGGTYNQNMQYYDLSVKGTLPLGEVTSLFAQVGGAYGAPGADAGSFPSNPAQADSHVSSWNFMSGVGMEVNLTKNIAMSLSDLYYYGPSAGVQGNTNVLLLGVKYQM